MNIDNCINMSFAGFKIILKGLEGSCVVYTQQGHSLPNYALTHLFQLFNLDGYGKEYLSIEVMPSKLFKAAYDQIEDVELLFDVTIESTNLHDNPTYAHYADISVDKLMKYHESFCTATESPEDDFIINALISYSGEYATTIGSHSFRVERK